MEQNSSDRNLPETFEIYQKHQHVKLTNRNEPKQIILINRKKGETNERNQHAQTDERNAPKQMALINRETLQPLRTERPETDEAYH